MLAHQEPSLYQSLLSGLEPVMAEPVPEKSLLPMSTAATTAAPATKSNSTLAASARANRARGKLRAIRGPINPSRARHRLAREPAAWVTGSQDAMPPGCEIPFVTGEPRLVVAGHDQDVGRIAPADEVAVVVEVVGRQ